MKKTQYDGFSKEYDSHMKLVKTNEGDIVDKLGLTDKEIDVLELGSGSGIDAERLLGRYPKIRTYRGLDNSIGMQKIAEERVKDKRVSFEQADIDGYVFSEEKYDLVFGIFSIHYTNDLEKLMKNVYGCLKKEGIFFIKDSHPLVGFFRKKSKDYRVKEKVVFPVAGGGKVMVEHPTFTVDEYINAATEAGFKIEKLDEQMGSQSEVLGINGYKIPTKLILILRK
jgi:ubiquinone/menaquinone biosynthesis C-methylase UbiE